MRSKIRECTKKKFKNFWDAHARLLEIKKISTEDKIPVRIYYCKNCGCHHLTSIEDNTKFVQQQNKKKEKQKKRDNIFINREAKYWNKKFGIEE